MLPNSTLAINDMDMDLKVEISRKNSVTGGAAKILKLK